MAPVDRIDHFARLRSPLPRELPPEMKIVGNEIASFADLVEHLREKFQRSVPIQTYSLDDAIQVANRQSREAGQDDIIRYIEDIIQAKKDV